MSVENRFGREDRKLFGRGDAAYYFLCSCSYL